MREIIRCASSPPSLHPTGYSNIYKYLSTILNSQVRTLKQHEPLDEEIITGWHILFTSANHRGIFTEAFLGLLLTIIPQHSTNKKSKEPTKINEDLLENLIKRNCYNLLMMKAITHHTMKPGH